MNRLWSLLSMLEFYAEPFVSALQAIARLHAYSDEHSRNPLPGADESIPYPIETLEVAEKLLADLKAIELPVSIGFVDDLVAGLRALVHEDTDGKKYIRVSKTSSSVLVEKINALELGLKHELASAKFYKVRQGATHYSVGDLPFGSKVEQAFNNAEDLVEAANCLAFGRFTASVFHLMRAMELAVKKLGTNLSITLAKKDGIDKSWGQLLAEFKENIDKMPKPEQPPWFECLALLSAVNIAWRNQTMHPKQTYTREEAEAIFEAVKAFMIRLAPLTAEC